MAKTLEEEAGGFEQLFVKKRDRLVSRRRYFVDMVQDRQRFRTPSEMLLVEDGDDLVVMKRIMGDAFGAGVRKVIKTGSGHVSLCIADILNMVCPLPTQKRI